MFEQHRQRVARVGIVFDQQDVAPIHLQVPDSDAETVRAPAIIATRSQRTHCQRSSELATCVNTLIRSMTGPSLGWQAQTA
jgi:hypothetical protein